MKRNHIYYSLFFFTLLFMVACSPQEDGAVSLGNTVPISNINVTVLPDEKVSNLYHFEVTSDWPFINGIFDCEDAFIDYIGTSFSQKVQFAGDYELKVQVFNRAGISEVKIVKFNVPKNDPTMKDDKNVINLTSGKTWIIASDLQGHIGCGPSDSDTPDWWSANPNELMDKFIYDDELRFVLTDVSVHYYLEAHGKIFVNESAAKTMAPDQFPDGSNVAVVVNYTQPEGQRWAFMESAGVLYLRFSKNAFPSYVAHPNALGGKYIVEKLTEDQLFLKWSGPGINWYYKFKVKN